MPRVFVVQEQPHMNISPAMDFGELIFMIGPGEHALNPGRAISSYRECMEQAHFQPEDYLLLIGDPILIGCAVAIADQWLQAQYLDGGNSGFPINVLKWDRELKRYLHLALPLST